MNFSTDRDLLVIEPNVFRDVPVVGQQRLKTTDGVVSGVMLTSASADFVMGQVDTGGVVLVAGEPLEVLSRIDSNTLTVSKLRTNAADASIPPGDGSGLEVIVRTYAPQAAVVHENLLRLMGIETDDPENNLTENSVISRHVAAHLEALGTLERVYEGAAALVGDNDEIRNKARGFGARFATACRVAIVLLDADGDGQPDIQRRLGVSTFTRV